MEKIENVIKELKDGLDFKIYDNTCVLLTVATVSNALELLKEQPKWTFFTTRPMTDEEKEYYGMYEDDAEMMENCPEDGEEVILYTPWGMSIDIFHNDVEGCYFDNHDEIEAGYAWMPTPKPPKVGEQE